MASKQINYCSLEEAWGEKYANIYKKNDSMLTNMPEKTNDNPIILKDRSLSDLNTDITEYYMNVKKDINEKKSCNDILDHITNCEDCKQKLNKILQPAVPEIKESFMNMHMNNNGVMDIIILILLGIFVIFILDCFVRLGKNFRK